MKPEHISSPMRVHVLQHVPFEGLGSIEGWLKTNQAVISHTRFYEDSFSLPTLEDLDLIVLLGGPMSVNDSSSFPWLLKEKAWISEALNTSIPMLGICLGAQLIASAMGSVISTADHKELGWFPVYPHQNKRHPENNDSGLDDESDDKNDNDNDNDNDNEHQPFFSKKIIAFHWHGETFELPAGANLLASSDGCRHQAVRFKEKVIGLQFHLECTETWVRSILKHCARELEAADGPFVQPKATISSPPLDHFTQANQTMAQILSYLTSKDSRASHES